MLFRKNNFSVNTSLIYSINSLSIKYLLFLFLLHIETYTCTKLDNVGILQTYSPSNLKVYFNDRYISHYLCKHQIQIFETKKYFCRNNKVGSQVVEEYNNNFNPLSDTLTQDDIVMKQYALLPYPAVSQQEIMKVKQHYNSVNRHIPYHTTPSQTLESLNHFLYKGKNGYM